MVPQVYDKSMRRLAYLENATAIGYELPLNELWTASFSLPADDPKNEYCSVSNYVEIYDGEFRIGLFRIIGQELTRENEAYCVYRCEHVLATLLGDLIYKYMQIGNVGVYTDQVLRYLLDRQEVKHWELAGCDFRRQFEYNFENTNLLAALFAVPKCFDQEYQWTWDTTQYPWRLSLRELSQDLGGELRYRKNLLGMTKRTDATNIVNRIYPLGYGEGDNQLDITKANDGQPYLDDVASQAEYGIIKGVLIDQRYESAETLKAYAQQQLSETARPQVSYEVQGIDLFRLTGDDFSQLWPGRIYRVIEEPDNIVVRTRVVNVSKSDVNGDPGAVTVTLANKMPDIAGSISDLQNRALINESYAQGATNLMMQDYADNADVSHPATLQFWVPASAVRINKVLLSVQFEPFRGYSQAVSSTTINLSTTQYAGGTTQTSSAVSLTPQNTVAPDSGGPGQANHNHGIQEGVRLAVVDYNNQIIGNTGFVPAGSHTHGEHTHEVEFEDHYHKITMPSHSHDMQHGIYEGQTADSAVITVDGEVIPEPEDWNEIDLVDYLSKDNSGRIMRNQWHQIRITPNKQSRIVAALFTQLFTNSRGGGDY